MKVKNLAVLFEQEKDGGYSVSVPTLPGCFSQGDTFEEALKNIQEAIELYLEDEELPEEPVKEFFVPNHKIIRPGTLNNILKKSGISSQELINLLKN